MSSFAPNLIALPVFPGEQPRDSGGPSSTQRESYRVSSRDRSDHAAAQGKLNLYPIAGFELSQGRGRSLRCRSDWILPVMEVTRF